MSFSERGRPNPEEDFSMVMPAESAQEDIDRLKREADEADAAFLRLLGERDAALKKAKSSSQKEEVFAQYDQRIKEAKELFVETRKLHREELIKHGIT